MGLKINGKSVLANAFLKIESVNLWVGEGKQRLVGPTALRASPGLPVSTEGFGGSLKKAHSCRHESWELEGHFLRCSHH